MSVAQLLLHVPQLRESAAVFVSQPFGVMPSQLVKPALHIPIAHAPPTHASTALGKLQTFPQAPQCDTFVFVFVSQPLAGILSQLPNVPSHVPIAQAPATQDSVALASEHGELQAPQCITFVCTFVSQPLAFIASQF
jgi:hypothetical protein